MTMRKLLTLSTLVVSALSTSAAEQVPLGEASSSRGSNLRNAKENGIQVFNALHASMRQWDSSLKHNGMSFFVASIPNNTLLYHGTHTDKAIEGPEWLAFEIEHAEVFARTRGPGGGGPGGGGPGRGPPGGGPGGGGRGPPEDEERGRGSPSGGPGPRKHMAGTTAEGDGYLHIYKTKKSLTKILYLDGMSAGKTTLGTLDTQDRIFLNKTTDAPVEDPPRRSGPFGDYERAQAMCGLGEEFGIDGIIRLEAGFELILCNFSTSVDLVSAYQRPKSGVNESVNVLGQFEYVRGISKRYEGITAGRVSVDYSSMVSAFFYPLNLTNPDATRLELPRLPAEDKAGIAQLKSDVLAMLKGSKTQSSSIDWQGVVDMIVTRYSDRLQYLIMDSSTQEMLLSEVNFLLSVFIDYKETSPSIPSAIEKCTEHYLLPVTPVTISDQLIYASIETVSRKICMTLFSARSVLLKGGELTEVKTGIKDLTQYLDWSTWKECGKCGYDEVCFVAIWPWGGVKDHFEPGCVKNEQLSGRSGYWGGFGH